MWLTRKPASGVNLPGGLRTAPSPARPDLPAAIVSPQARAPVPRSDGVGDEVRSDHDPRQSMQRTPRSEIQSAGLGRTADRAAGPPGRAAARKPAIWFPDLKPRTGAVRSRQETRATDGEPSPGGPHSDPFALCSSSNSVQTVAQVLSGLEKRDVLFGNRYTVAGSRVAADPGITSLNRERAKTAQLHPIAAC
jgi:hypothetical protein